ncbi:MAG TPA: type II secretion system protein [Candidatus Paceibacterota bacterium]|nr:type II secretion system protein [Candidatus Paceibacterota bacterium]
MKSKQGFTLIELLVVIAIIGILAGLVIVSMSGSQNAAKNARIQSDMNQLRSQAQLYYINNGTSGFSGLATAPSIAQLTSDINANAPASVSILVSASPYSAYCAVVSINPPVAGTSYYWCVDSLGNAVQLSGTLTKCTGTTYTCQ